MTALLIAEFDGDTLRSGTLSALAATQKMDQDVHVLIAGSDSGGAASAAAALPGVSKVLHADAAVYDHALSENVAPLVAKLSGDYAYVVAPHSTFGKNVMPRAAALADAQQISDIVEVVDGETFVRPIYAGNATATVKSADPVKFVTVRGTAFEPGATEGGSAAVEAVDATEDAGLSSFVGQELTKSERPELTTARIVISGGRGMQSSDNFALLESVADKLGAAVGASRAAVDSGYAPNDYQVGQTGKVVAPDLYIAVGISGAIQHLAGMKDSKVIVAINKDEEAPIFQVADYGLVADLFQALPELEKELG